MITFLKHTITTILWILARVVLWKYKPTIVAVTGSVGKTTAKDAIYHALATSRNVRRSEKSYNSELGIPLAILGRVSGWRNPLSWIATIGEGVRLIVFKTAYPSVLVLEVGADRPGDIARVAPRIAPHVAVITRFGDVPVHVEFFASPEEVYKEKEYLVKALRPGGMLVVNNDDARARAMKNSFPGMCMTYGIEKQSAVMASYADVYYEHGIPAGITFKAEYGGTSVPIFLRGVLGTQYVSGILAGLAVGVGMGINLVRLAQSVGEYEGTPGRMRIIAGVRDSVLIDDSYNSSPVAAEAALLTLSSIKIKEGGRKIAILGDMRELGIHSIRAHERLGGLSAGVADMLFFVGEYADQMRKGAITAGFPDERVFTFHDADYAGEELVRILTPHDIVLVKGSQSVRMEKIVARAMAHPEAHTALLVRQEPEWVK